MTDDLLTRLDFCANLHPQMGYPENGRLFREAAARIRSLTADLAAMQDRAEKAEAGWKVKPLVWTTHCPDTGGCAAKAFGGDYILETDEPGGEFGMWFPEQGEGSDTDFYFPDLEAAKAAAQADYEARIMAALGSSLS